MFLLRHVLFFVLYSALAAGIIYFAPNLLPDLTEVQAVFLGGFCLMAGILLHECFARLTNERANGKLLLSLRRAHSKQAEELETLGRLVEPLLDPSSDGKPGRADKRVDAVIAEVKVLQSLIEQLSEAKKPEGRGSEPSFFKGGPKRPKAALTARPADRQLPSGHPLSPETLARAAAAMDAKIGDEDEITLTHEVPAETTDATDQNPPEMRILEGELTREAILEIAQEALRDDRVDLVLQPIVSLPQRKRRHYECFSRLRTRNGLTVLPEHYISIAEEAGFIDAIDNMLLFRCVQLLRKVERSGEMVDFFCNLSGRTLTNGSFFGDFLDFLESEKALAPRMVFEFCQHDYENWPATAITYLERLKELGCRLSIDQVSDLTFEPAAMTARGIRYIKLSAKMVIEELRPDSGLLRDCRDAGLMIVVEKIETEEMMRELLDYDLDYGQGYLFSEPRLARPAA